MTTGPLDLSLVIPAFNEEETLSLLLAEIRAVLNPSGLRYEVIFVDDGSQDRTAEIIRGFHDQDPRVRLIRLKTNSGESAATDAGIKAARGRYVVTMDADLQNDPRDIPALLANLDRWDAAVGWRVKREDPWTKRIASRIANWVRNTLSGDDVRDSGCTFRAFRRECLRELVLYRGFHRFIPTLLRIQGYRVIEVPVRHRPRQFGRSKYGIWDRAGSALMDLLVVRWMKDRQLRYQVAEDLGGGLSEE